MDTNVLVDFILRGIRVLRPQEVVFDDSAKKVATYRHIPSNAIYMFIFQMINFVDSRGASGEQLQNTQVYWKGKQPFFFSFRPLLSLMKKGQTKPTQRDLFMCSSLISDSTDQKLGGKMLLFGEIL